ncbi:MAG: hypothetical protein HYX55_01215 [Chloroflexi bacterium]|nr:hypothetical protein [Chloroflexota bacterium]
MSRRLISVLLGLMVLVPYYAGHAQPAAAAEVKGYLKDVEVRWRWSSSSSWSPWEDPAFAQNYASTSRQMQVWVEVYAKSSQTFKIGLWSANDSRWLSTTSQSVAGGQTYAWQSPALTTPVVEEALGVYLYYWNGSAYVYDDDAVGWIGVHSYLDQPGDPTVADWGPNGVTRPTFTQSSDGQYVTVRQMLWWWNNSYYTSQTNGSTRLNRLKAWANMASSVNWTIEFRREDRPGGAGQGSPQDKDGWDFCVKRENYCYFLTWSSNIPGLRTSDVEEVRDGGNEEAQFETGSDQIRNYFAIVTGQKPHFSYANQYYLQVQFLRLFNRGQQVWVKTNSQLQGLHPLPTDEYWEYMTQTLTTL